VAVRFTGLKHVLSICSSYSISVPTSKFWRPFSITSREGRKLRFFLPSATSSGVGKTSRGNVSEGQDSGPFPLMIAAKRCARRSIPDSRRNPHPVIEIFDRRLHDP
jgi:hypothetical protein